MEPGLLDHNQAVSEVVARAMAEGAPKRSQAEIAIGVTGFAGPAGPDNDRTFHREKHFSAVGRGEVRVKSPKTMLEMLEKALEQ